MKLKLGLWDRTLTHYLWPREIQGLSGKDLSMYFPKDYQELVNAVCLNSRPEEIIWGDFSPAANLVAALSGRSTASAMMSEVAPYRVFDPLAVAKLSLWFKDKDQEVRYKQMEHAIQVHHLRLVADTKLAYVYENPSAPPIRRDRYFVVPTFVCFLMMVIVLSVACGVLDGR